VIQQLNEQFYGFDLYGYDTMQYTEYESVEGGKYDFHMDTIMGRNVPVDMQTQGIRKLSLTIALNEPGVDFEGGHFQINQGQEIDAENVELKKGRIIAFPSFMLHRVAPTTKGKRKSLVVWVLGPKFK
jgi:PKHD-type hydroxylase